MNILFNQTINSFWKKYLDPLLERWASPMEAGGFPSDSISGPFSGSTTGQGQHRIWFGKEGDYPGLEAMEVILGGKPDREMVEAARSLKLIIVPFAGVNHLPLELLARRGVRAANSHGNASFVAEC
jgi:hypothetical protein